MPKTTSKKSAHTTTKTKKVTRKPTSTHNAGSYHHQREQFFVTHPNGKTLLTVFVLAVAVYVGALLWGQILLYNAEVMTPGAVQANF